MTDVTEVNELGENTELKELNALIQKANRLGTAASMLEDGPAKEQLVEQIEAQRVSLQGMAVSDKWLFS